MGEAVTPHMLPPVKQWKKNLKWIFKNAVLSCRFLKNGSVQWGLTGDWGRGGDWKGRGGSALGIYKSWPPSPQWGTSCALRLHPCVCPTAAGWTSSSWHLRRTFSRSSSRPRSCKRLQRCSSRTRKYFTFLDTRSGSLLCSPRQWTTQPHEIKWRKGWKIVLLFVIQSWCLRQDAVTQLTCVRACVRVLLRSVSHLKVLKLIKLKFTCWLKWTKLILTL